MGPDQMFYVVLALTMVFLLFKIHEVADAIHAVAGTSSSWVAGGGTIVVFAMALELGHYAVMTSFLAPTTRLITQCRLLENQLLNDIGQSEERLAADQDGYNACAQRLRRLGNIMGGVIAK
jgi:hypothetical protein